MVVVDGRVLCKGILGSLVDGGESRVGSSDAEQEPRIGSSLHNEITR